MEAVAEGLWGLAEYHEKRGEIGKAVKCLEAICQSDASFFPIVEVKTRLRIATLLLHHSHNVNHAKSHLERSVSPLLSFLLPSNSNSNLWLIVLFLCVFFFFDGVGMKKMKKHKIYWVALKRLCSRGQCKVLQIL